MKKILMLIVLLMAVGLTQEVAAQKMRKVTIKWTFEGVEEGFDHDNKMVVSVDGESAGESTVKKETESNQMIILVPAGTHEIRAVNMALYEGEWEEHTEANEYSLDCIFSDTITFKKKATISIVFNIDGKEVVSTVSAK